MNSLGEVNSQTENGQRKEIPNRFQRKLLTDRIPKRYIIALFLFILQIIHHWIYTNDVLALAAIFATDEDEDVPEDTLSEKGNWTGYELDGYLKASMASDVIFQIPGALLIFYFSSHKYLLLSTILTSIFHMLIPVALTQHSACLVVVLFIQSTVASPLDIAVMAIWKDWAPSLERSKLIVFSFAGSFLTGIGSAYYVNLIADNIREEHFYYAGFSGLIWAVFWYNLTYDTPQHDPLISEQELLYLEGNISSDIQQKIKISDIPWKSIVTSKQVLILSLIFVKMACSFSVFILANEFLNVSAVSELLSLEICFILLFAIIMPCSAIVADFLIKTYNGRILLIRKCYLCGGFLLQSVFILGTFSPSQFTKTICYFIAYTFYVASLPGFFTIPLDLSPKYVAIISGIVFTFYSLENVCMDFILDGFIHLKGLHIFSWILLIDLVLSLICAVLFFIWGEVEEQLWSLNLPTRSRVEGYKSYPSPEDQDDVNLVPETGDGDIFKI